MNENIDLTQILKDCPKGTKFYSSLHGDLLYSCMYLSSSASKITFIKPDSVSMVDESTPITVDYYRDGRYYPNQGECTIFPSIDQRDWSKFTAPWYKHEEKKEMKENIEPNKKEKFDPKTFQPFDKVIIRHDACSEWEVSLFSHRNTYYDIDDLYSFCTVTNKCVVDCIPYNDETKHLVGTTDAAPDFYKYWED